MVLQPKPLLTYAVRSVVTISNIKWFKSKIIYVYICKLLLALDTMEFFFSFLNGCYWLQTSWSILLSSSVRLSPTIFCVVVDENNTDTRYVYTLMCYVSPDICCQKQKVGLTADCGGCRFGTFAIPSNELRTVLSVIHKHLYLVEQDLPI